MVRKILIIIVAVIGMAVAFGAGSITGALAGGTTNDPVQPQAAALGGAGAKFARTAAIVAAGGAVQRSKGVTAVTHPSTGLYCVDPSADYDVTKIVPNIGVDWSTSLGDALLAQYRSSGVGCPAGNIAILTMDGEDGSFDLSDSVSFTVTVP
jgi:hypothetical protein